MNVCVLIPTYNESKAIGRIVRGVRQEALDVVVVDDGSHDNTAEIARENGAFVIAQKINCGKGASLRRGFEYVLRNGYQAVIIIDGDGQHDPFDIKRFIQSAETTGADLVIGNRMTYPTAMPFVRRLTNKWMSAFISGICGQKIPDTQCGFRFIKGDVLKKVKLVSSKYETESEMLIRAAMGKFKIHSMTIKSIYSGQTSTIHPVADALRFIRLILSIRLEKARREYGNWLKKTINRRECAKHQNRNPV